MEKKLKTYDVKSLLNYVIKTIDRWWIDTMNRKQGCFTRSNINNDPVTYKDYVEWRCSERSNCKGYSPNYVSIFISLEYEDGMDYIRIALKKLKDGVYSEYDPFCEIHDGKIDVIISEDTGGYDEQFSVFESCFNELTDRIATAVSRFTDLPSYYEGTASVNMDEVSKTLSIHDIQDCMIKAMRIMIIDRDTVNELMRLRSKFIAEPHDLPLIQCNNTLGYTIEVTPKHVTTMIVYGETITLCSFTCMPDTYGQHEFIIRYNSCDTGFEYAQGFNILYKNPDEYCFEYAADGLNVDKIFKPFVNILRNTLNYELYQFRFQDTAITAPAGLMTKEVFVLDENFFKSGDIYLLHISPEFHGVIHNGTALAPDAHIPSKVYAICTDTHDGTVIDFMFKPEEPLVGIHDLVWIQVHADEIESGLITVKRVLMNETLIQDTDEE